MQTAGTHHPLTSSTQPTPCWTVPPLHPYSLTTTQHKPTQSSRPTLVTMHGRPPSMTALPIPPSLSSTLPSPVTILATMTLVQTGMSFMTGLLLNTMSHLPPYCQRIRTKFVHCRNRQRHLP